MKTLKSLAAYLLVSSLSLSCLATWSFAKTLGPPTNTSSLLTRIARNPLYWYQKKIIFQKTPEPWLSIGLKKGLKNLGISTSAPLKISWITKDQQLRELFKPTGGNFSLQLVKSTPAIFKDYQILETITPPKALSTAQQQAIRQKWPTSRYSQILLEPLPSHQTALSIDEDSLKNLAPYPLFQNILTPKYRYLVLQEKLSPRALNLAAQKTTSASPNYRRLIGAPRGLIAIAENTTEQLLDYANSYIHFSVDSANPIGIGLTDALFQEPPKNYPGDIYVTLDSQGQLTAVNLAPVEEILKGVLPGEMPPKAPLAALKAQSIAARNILLAHAAKKHPYEPFHLCAEEHCQVYTPLQKREPLTNLAVETTHGEFLFLKQKLVNTVYASTCGGHTENNETAWFQDPDPALRGRPDIFAELLTSPLQESSSLTLNPLDNIFNWLTQTAEIAYCAPKPSLLDHENSPLSPRDIELNSLIRQAALTNKPENWRFTKRFSRLELESLLREREPQFKSLKNILIAERGVSGRITKLLLEDGQKTLTIVKELPIRLLFGGLKSAAWVITNKQIDKEGVLQELTLQGGGFGHGVGMCQFGAIGRAYLGATYEQILNYYYNGALLRKLY